MTSSSHGRHKDIISQKKWNSWNSAWKPAFPTFLVSPWTHQFRCPRLPEEKTVDVSSSSAASVLQCWSYSSHTKFESVRGCTWFNAAVGRLLCLPGVCKRCWCVRGNGVSCVVHSESCCQGIRWEQVGNIPAAGKKRPGGFIQNDSAWVWKTRKATVNWGSTCGEWVCYRRRLPGLWGVELLWG